jgi:diaminohydroxyphosphoribosylaminopyrimidine deaminase/5-amino-6-(5-phosphoribosylamino)uracil reductase
VTESDERFLGEALALAADGVGFAAPNPAVGCVLVKDGRVIGRGSHRFMDADHAEVLALREAGAAAAGSTAFVSLEPCSSVGRTPPCTDALVRAGVTRVVAALPDPDPRHRGEALERLSAEGVDAAWGPAGLRREALLLIEHFAHWRLTGRPFVTLKAAASLDGRTAAANGESRWITGAEARRAAHEARRAHAAILCGVGTVLADDPALTVRLDGLDGLAPLRVVLDPSLRTPLTARLLDGSGGPVLIATTEDAAATDAAGALRDAGASLLALPGESDALDLSALLAELGGRRSINGLLVEGGGLTTGRFLAAGLGDEALIFLAPLLLGGAGGEAAAFSGFCADSLGDGLRLSDLRSRSVGADLELRGRLPGGFDPDSLLADLNARWGEAN